MSLVRDIMTKNVVTIESSKTVYDAAQLMAEKRLGALLVVIKGFPVGIITEKDIVHRVVAKRANVDARLSETMTKTLITVEPETSIREAARVMAKNKIHRLPVLKGNKLMGIVAASDFVRNAGKKTTTEEILEALRR